MHMKPLYPLCLLALCGGLVHAQTSTSGAASSASGIDLGAIDKSADPCDNFYQYACGTWLKDHPVPPDQGRWGRFDELHERNQKILREIAEDAAQNPKRSPLDQKIGDFYGSCMDESHIGQLGTRPIQPGLDRIAALQSKKDLVPEVASLHLAGSGVLFSFGASPDPDNAKNNIGDLDQGGLGLPEKDYYFRKDEKSEQLRTKYVEHIARMFQLTGVPADEAAKKAATVMRIETDLAQGSLDIVARRDPKALVHKYATKDLAALSPAFDLKQYFLQVKAPGFETLNVATPDFIKATNKVIEDYDLGDLKDYLAWHYISASADALPQAFVDENFDFYGKTLSGAQQLKPRWKRCVQATDGALGEAIGRKYVEKTFGEQGKERTLDMVGRIEQSMAADLESVSWMTPETKKQALVKLKAVTNKIGYPEHWRDYSSLEIQAGDYLGNVFRADEFEARRDLQKIGQPVDRSEWEMTPPTVNAYYEPLQNNINFPAGILQPPFYSNKADDAVNFGAIGAVIGHELTHGFDDEGRQFDADGNLRDWWRQQDQEAFNKLEDCFVEQYGGYEPLPDVHLNGKLTLGENTADNGGMRLAYMALMSSLAAHNEDPDKKQDGYTAPQRFFLGWGQIWCSNQTPEMSRMRVQVDPHSPSEFRVNGVLRNMESFRKAWSCQADAKMEPPAGQGCRVW
jgi:putative endopeptidase